jgi:hypothetical protein
VRREDLCRGREREVALHAGQDIRRTGGCGGGLRDRTGIGVFSVYMQYNCVYYCDTNSNTNSIHYLQDVHVETYGSLSKKEKAQYILEQVSISISKTPKIPIKPNFLILKYLLNPQIQMRLNLIRKDYIRALIHSRKMNTKTLEEEGFGEVKQVSISISISKIPIKPHKTHFFYTKIPIKPTISILKYL